MVADPGRRCVDNRAAPNNTRCLAMPRHRLYSAFPMGDIRENLDGLVMLCGAKRLSALSEYRFGSAILRHV
jgi:hypothetical protein